MANYTETDVKHDENQKMFYIQLKNCDKKAFLQYEKSDQKNYDLWHTEVPDECRGQGVGAILASKSIQQLANENPTSKIILTCSYLQHFYKKNQSEKFQQYENIQI